MENFNLKHREAPPVNIESNLTTEERRDFLYARAINPDTPPRIKKLLDPAEIRTASPERLEELEQLLGGQPAAKAIGEGKIISFPDKEERERKHAHRS